MENKVVAHTRAGKLHKGVTHDFDRSREKFHILPAEGGGVPIAIELNELKALFYVKDFLGNREYSAPEDFGSSTPSGQRCQVTFFDGEIVRGYALDFDESAAGFHIVPLDPADNNHRIFVLKDATTAIEFQ